MAPRGSQWRQRARDDAGLTLAEMVVAVGILMVVLIATVAALTTTYKAQRVAEGTDRATQIANDRIERFRQLDWKDIGFYSDTYNTSAGPAYGTYFPRNGSGGPEQSIVNTSATSPLPAGTDRDRSKAYYVDTSLKNRFEVYTYITWGDPPVPGYGSIPTSPSGGPYTFKRVRVVVLWSVSGSGAQKVTVNESWFAPDSSDAIPPGVAYTTGP